MGQLFPRFANFLARLSLVLGILAAVFVLSLPYILPRSVFTTKVNLTRDQNVPFSHKHHVDGLGIDCRFCHTQVERSPSAGIPSTETCMKCHSIMWKDSPMLEPVRESWKTGKPLIWNRVHDMPDHVYFNHSIHIKKGMACATCHGQVDQMPLMWKSKTMQMEWCLACHRHPESQVRPRDSVTEMNWKAPKDWSEQQKELAKQYQVKSIDNCNACHR